MHIQSIAIPFRLGRLAAGVIAVQLLVAAPSFAADKKAKPGAGAQPTAAPTAGKGGDAKSETKTQPNYGTAPTQPFTESTRMRGKVDADLRGVWLLVAKAELTQGKYRSFPQLLKITNDKDGTPQFHIMDVQLPQPIQESVDKANYATLEAWVPDDAQRKILSEQWEKLPLVKEKKIDEFLYLKVDYAVVAPDHYKEQFPRRNPVMDKTLDGSKFSLQIVESYAPRKLPDDAPVAQVVRRHTIYGVKDVGNGVLKGDQILGFVAAGPGVPVPMQLGGQFIMYRLATLS